MKKFIAFLSAVSLLSAFTIPVSAETDFSMSDLKNLNDILLNGSETKSEYDLNENNTADVFDSCIMKNMLLNNSSSETGEAVEKSIAVSDESVKFTGRNVSADGVSWLVQSGSAVEFTVNAQNAEVVLNGDGGINSGEDYRPRYAVYVDDELIIDKTMDNAEETIQLFEGTSSRTAQVKVILLSEAMYGAVGVKQINVLSASSNPVKPAPKKDLCIEFIGDSITCAYGVEGASNSESFKTTTENFTKSYAYLTAQQLNADYNAVCYSGHGVISGFTTDEKNTESLIPDCYEIASKFEGYSEKWDFDSHKNDVVVINLGTNDSGYVSADIENRSSEFIEGYINFLKMVRKNNPDAHIICTLGTMGCADVYQLVEQAVEQYSSENNDEKVSSYESIVQSAADGYGSDWHPSAVTQQNSAYVLADKICQVLGMESSQIGLDMAANAVYDTAIDSEAGANAASYVGYDKSFWINVVAGGSEPSAIEGVLSGIELRKDGEYRLEFDYTSTVDAEIPVVVRSETKEYFSDSVKAVAEKQHFSQTFKVTSENDIAEIAFQLGGMDYYNVTLSNIKLVKIS